MLRLCPSVILLSLLPVLQGQDFFPEGVLDQAARYSGYLAAMQEPSLWQLSRAEPTAEMYRFTWLRTFHRPIGVRLVVDEKRRVTVVTKVLNGLGGYDPGRLIVNRSKRLDPQRAAAFLLDPIPDFDKQDPTANDRITLDGAEWIVEWIKDGHYRVVVRTSPPPSDPVHYFGMLLADDLADLKLLYREVY